MKSHDLFFFLNKFFKKIYKSEWPSNVYSGKTYIVINSLTQKQTIVKILLPNHVRNVSQIFRQ